MPKGRSPPPALGIHNSLEGPGTVDSVPQLLPQCPQPTVHTVGFNLTEAHPVDSRRSRLAAAARASFPEHILTPDLVPQAVEPAAGFLPGFRQQCTPQLRNLSGFGRAKFMDVLINPHGCRCFVSFVGDQGAFPPSGLPDFIGTTPPSAAWAGRPRPSRAGRWWTAAISGHHPLRFPSFRWVSIPCVLPPLPRWDPSQPFALLSRTAAFPVIMAGRLPQRHFEACTVFTSHCGPHGFADPPGGPFPVVLQLICFLL